MMEGENDVIIHLVPPNEQEIAVSRKRTRDSPEQSLNPTPVGRLGVIHANSSRLRQCSRYFDVCMSERWATSCTQREFDLDLHTEVKYYHDCFFRMRWPFKPMSSVTDCIQILKVASQIQYEEVIENSLRYLASVPWSDDEERQIRTFCGSSHNTTSDLSKRLEERQEELLRITRKALSFALQTLHSEPVTSTIRSRKHSLTMINEIFKVIVTTGSLEKVLPMVVALMIEESEKTLVSMKKVCQDAASQNANRAVLVQGLIFLNNLDIFGWLFTQVRSMWSAQATVELLLKDPELLPLVQAMCQSVSSWNKGMQEKRWATMISTIFQDVMEGRLFLKTADRLVLFRWWNWTLKVKIDASLNPTLVSDFIMGFPHEDQEEIFRCWVNNLGDPAHQTDYNLAAAHIRWVKHLVVKAEKSGSGCGLDSGSSV